MAFLPSDLFQLKGSFACSYVVLTYTALVPTLVLDIVRNLMLV